MFTITGENGHVTGSKASKHRRGSRKRDEDVSRSTSPCEQRERTLAGKGTDAGSTVVRNTEHRDYLVTNCVQVHTPARASNCQNQSIVPAFSRMKPVNVYAWRRSRHDRQQRVRRHETKTFDNSPPDDRHPGQRCFLSFSHETTTSRVHARCFNQ